MSIKLSSSNSIELEVVLVLVIPSHIDNRLARIKPPVEVFNIKFAFDSKCPYFINWLIGLLMHDAGYGCDHTWRSAPGILWSKIDWITEVDLTTWFKMLCPLSYLLMAPNCSLTSVTLNNLFYFFVLTNLRDWNSVAVSS